tara:strand:- start:195 stop:464 length:270 start_codon:yes stop_codon:yes gene_type:complete
MLSVNVSGYKYTVVLDGEEVGYITKLPDGKLLVKVQKEHLENVKDIVNEFKNVEMMENGQEKIRLLDSMQERGLLNEDDIVDILNHSKN